MKRSNYWSEHCPSRRKIGERLCHRECLALVCALLLSCFIGHQLTQDAASGRIQRAYYSSRGYMHEVGLYGLLQGQTPSVIRVSILYECFNSIMKYLSCVLENALDEMGDWTSLDWRSLNFAIM